MGKGHKPEEIIGKLREAAIVLAQVRLQKDELDRENARLQADLA